jgi:hypothetical protein
MERLEQAIKCLANLEDTTKRNVKKDLLRSAADNPFLKEFFKRAYDWQTTYGLVYKQPELPKAKAIFGATYSIAEEWDVFLAILDALAARELTGQEAITNLDNFMHIVDSERAMWYGRVLNRDLRVGVNVNTFGEVWPDLRSVFAVSLAEKFNCNTTELSYPVAVEPKYDGLRITLVFRDGQGVARTRSGKEYNDVLRFVLAELGPLVGDGAVDGEIYADWESSGVLSTYGGKRYKSPWGKTSAMLKTGTSGGYFNPDRVSEGMWGELDDELKFWAFDCMSLDVYDPAIAMDKTPFSQRRDNLAFLVGELGEDAHTILMPQIIASNREELDLAHVHYMKAEHEGSMIKSLDAPYLPSRTAVMLKRKEEEFIDGVILEIMPGTGRNAKWAGAYRVRLPNGAEGRCNVRGDQNRQDHWDRRNELVGTVIEMTQQKDAKAVSATVRFPVFMRLRDDLPKQEV